MNNELSSEFTDIEELATIPLSELVEPQDLELTEIEPQDLELPLEYIQDLIQRGVITEEMPTIDLDPNLLESPEQSPFETSIERDEPFNEKDFDFGR
jgi:hypothetical protein